MAAQGYIGRAPGESSVVVARQTFTPTGITTNFTFASGYTVGYVDAYLNGARLIEGDDYTATDGSVVGLTTHAINGDVLELVAYKAFNVSNVTGTLGDFSIPDKIVHKEDTDTTIRFPQADTFTVETAGSEVLRVDANSNVGIGTTNTLAVADPKNQSVLNVGVVTANSITAAAGTFGSLNVSGTLTYEDVANQDVVGFSTFQKGINVQGAGSTTTTLNVTGVTTMTGDVNLGADFNIPDAITHVGDTNTKIRFPQADTFTVETGGNEAYRVDSSRRILLGHTSSRAIGHSSGDGKLQIEGTNLGTSELSIVRNSDNNGAAHLFIGKSRGSSVGDSTVVQDEDSLGVIGFVGADGTDLQTRAAQITAVVDGTPGSNDLPGRLIFSTTADGASSPTERLRLDSGGQVLINGGNDARSNFHGGGTTYRFQVESTSFETSAPAFICNSNTAGHGPHVTLARSRGTSVGSNTIVQDDDVVGVINFQGNDGTHFENVARIRAEIDGTPGANDMPGRLTFFTVADGSVSPTERVRINSSGRLLVGHTAQRGLGQLEIEGTTFENSGLTLVRNVNSTGGTALNICKTRGGKGSTTSVQDDDVLGGINFRGADGANLRDACDIRGEVDGSPSQGTDMPGRLVFRTSADGSSSPTERLRIESTGKTLINWGATNGGRFGRLVIFDGDDFSTASQPGINDNIYLSSDATSGDDVYGASIAFSRVQYQDRRAAAIAAVQTTSDEDQVGLAFFTHASATPTDAIQESVRIEHNGYMLIGTTTATSNTDRLLQVGDTSLSSAYIEVRTSTSGASGVVFSDNDDGSGSTGYRGSIEYLHSHDRLEFKTAGTTRLTCTSSGDFTATGNVTAYSDVTLKENIETIPNALDKVLNLRGVEFDRNDKENNPHEIGVIAQEVEEVVPEVVMTNEEGLKSVAYGNLVGLLIESIKELKAEVNDLKAQLEG